MSNIQKPEMTNGEEKNGLMKQFLQVLRHLFVHNWHIKLISVILSILLWGGLISQDPTLTRDKTFNNVSVNLTGKETLNRNGYVVVNDLNDLLQNCQITVAVPQQQYENAEANNFNVRLDLSKINASGKQEVRLSYTNSNTYGKVTGINPESITVDVEEYITRSRIPISVTMTGEAPEGWYITPPTADPSLIVISGPKSVVETISRARATVDLNEIIWEEGTSRIAVPFTLYDRYGEAVANPQIVTTSESVLIQSVVVEQNIYPVKTVDVSTLGIVNGTPAKGYEIKNTTFVPSKLRIAAPRTVLDGIDKVFPNSTVSATAASTGFSGRVMINRPSDVVYMSSDTINVEVMVEPVIIEREFKDLEIELRNAPKDMKVTASIRKCDAVVSGPQNTVGTLRKANVKVYADLDSLKEAGIYTLPLNYGFEDIAEENMGILGNTEEIHISLEQK